MPGRAAGEIAYLAGVFDGEGSVHVGRGIHVSVQMTDLDILERFRAVFGGSIYDRKPRPGLKRSWTWQLGNRADAFRFLDAVRPYLGERRQGQLDDVEHYRYPKQFLDREKALLMRADLGMTYREIGPRLGLSPKWVESIVNRPGSMAVADA